MPNHYCKYCGYKATSVHSLTSGFCPRHPAGPNKGKHALYEGGEKSQYTCKNCGSRYSALSQLTSAFCPRHPDGPNKGKHQPAL
jgi:DNA-directed RNA polymerase subunit RPC12/RpoP